MPQLPASNSNSSRLNLSRSLTNSVTGKPILFTNPNQRTSLRTKLLLVLASTVILVSKPHRTRDHILLSDGFGSLQTNCPTVLLIITRHRPLRKHHSSIAVSNCCQRNTFFFLRMRYLLTTVVYLLISWSFSSNGSHATIYLPLCLKAASLWPILNICTLMIVICSSTCKGKRIR
jgi:hypothetical protein